MNTIDTRSIKDRYSIRDLARQIWGEPPRQGRQYDMYSSPFRSDSTPSLLVRDRLFRDFGDPDAKGDILNFVALYVFNKPDLSDKTAFNEVIAYITGENVIQSRVVPVASVPSKTVDMSDEDWSELMLIQCSRFHKNLINTPTAMQYLAERGYRKSYIHSSLIGWNPKGFRDEDGIWYGAGIVFPHMRQKNIRAVRIRCPHYDKFKQPDRLSVLTGVRPSRLKYISVTGSQPGQCFYGQMRTQGAPVFITEGQIDTDNLIQQLPPDCNVLTTGSTTDLLEDWLINGIMNWHPMFVAIVHDNDEAGILGADKKIEQFGSPSFLIFKHPPPIHHKDFSDAITSSNFNFDEWYMEAIDHMFRRER